MLRRLTLEYLFSTMRWVSGYFSVSKLRLPTRIFCTYLLRFWRPMKMMMRSSVMTTSTGDGGGMCLRVHHHQNRAFRLCVGHCEVRAKRERNKEKRNCPLVDFIQNILKLISYSKCIAKFHRLPIHRLFFLFLLLHHLIRSRLCNI